MKTLKYPIVFRQHFCLSLLSLALLALASSQAYAQTEPQTSNEETAESKITRPESSDSTSEKLIANYLAASGGIEAHTALKNVFVRGDIIEGKELKHFELTETSDGKRRLRLYWTLRGVDYDHVYCFDGQELWQHRRLPLDGKRNLTANYSGPDAVHFQHQRCFFHPFTDPLLQDYVFAYMGSDKTGKRDSYLVVGYGPKNERTWFYFDKENFLV